MILDPLVKVQVDVKVAVAELPANHLGVPLLKPGVADGDPLHRRPVVDLYEALPGVLGANRSVDVGLAQPIIKQQVWSSDST